MNLSGADYVVGDIHGCFSKLQEQLYVIGFDETKDRLFSVGDLVDRGPESEEFWTWLRKPWFHAALGNHDKFVIDAAREGKGSWSSDIHWQNGGEWFYGMSEVEQQCYALEMSELPLAIEVDTPDGLVGIVHAESPSNNWYEARKMLENPDDYVIATAIWARSKISDADETPITGLHKLYVGHSPNNEMVVLGNVHYIDTGAVFRGGKFTIVRIN
jgi:serine/threonine protein phosphatase 1